MFIKVGILTVSDRCSKGLRPDESGPALENLVASPGWQVEKIALVPDEVIEIKKVLIDWCDREKLDLILTTGGTGLGPRDVTPEATREILDKELPVLNLWMQLEGAKVKKRALLSRGISGSRKQSLIINLPGNPMAAVESLSSVLDLIPHALDMIAGQNHEEKAYKANEADKADKVQEII